ncbi:class I SAM-dependent methyltransferase [Aspergillus fischeri NRRL 181]|uniref:Methyltransferase domain-containing protein n=1 Tax=Neosartorya fischeri (strain ATCC 1020 / DSM 3700 / CBS 544.65 / FGSC A1164 / JCM 1740 / NRRL 181 / WB 181) TaxID=331117 RepID=A1DNT3_NEOFI|nr:conserved hypothetical protein [Aspergillus fischeri NRRL 181]EAW16454.1 conserved hypothetical protein [Aspergillus fischeri NRRL 181]
MTKTQAVAEKHDEESTSQYEVGSRISTLFAEELVKQSGIAQFSQKPLVIFDNACGTGAVSSALHRTLKDETTRSWQLTCGDISEAMVEATKQKMNKEGWRNAEVKVVDSQDTRLQSAHYTHIFSAFAVWITLIQSAIARISGDLPIPTTDDLFRVYNKNWADETSIHAQFEQAGFTDIKIAIVPKQYPLPVQELAEICKISLPHVTKFWTQQQRDLHYNEVPKMVLRILEEKMGKNGLASMEAEAFIATARKP